MSSLILFMTSTSHDPITCPFVIWRPDFSLHSFIPLSFWKYFIFNKVWITATRFVKCVGIGERFLSRSWHGTTCWQEPWGEARLVSCLKWRRRPFCFFLFPSGVCVPEPVLSFYFRSGETLDVITADYYTHDVSIRCVYVCVSLAWVRIFSSINR